MTDHDATVAAVLAKGIRIAGVEQERNHCSPLRDAEAALAALTAAGIRCLYVPEGVTVPHGAKLVQVYDWPDSTWFAIEATP